MNTRSQSKNALAAAKRQSASVTSSNSSSATIKAQKLAAEAAHVRRLADMERSERERTLEAERSVAEAEHRAQMAALEALECASQRSGRRSSRCPSQVSAHVEQWMDSNSKENTRAQNPTDSQMLDVHEYGTGAQALLVTDSVDGDHYQLPVSSGADGHFPYALTVADTCPPNPSVYAPQWSIPAGPLRTTATAATPGGASAACGPQGPATTTSAHWKPHQHYTLGTHNTNNCDRFNKDLQNSDSIQSLAQAIANVATTAKTRKVCASLPSFDGRPTDWLIFKKIYDDSSPSFSASENFVRLNAALRGPAREAVHVLLAAARDPLEVLRALETAFARPEQIILSELASVRALPRLSSQEGTSELVHFSNRVRNCVEVIRLLSQAEFLASPELSNEIISKLTPLLRMRWADFASAREASYPRRHRLELLSDFLVHEADLRSRYQLFTPSTKFLAPLTPVTGKPTRKEFCHCTSDHQTPTEPAVDTTVLATTATTPPTDKTCVYCEISGHTTRSCKRFIALSPEQRWHWAKSKKVCHKCLVKGAHRYNTCKRFSCEVDGCKSKRYHHTLLHGSPTDPIPAEDPIVVSHCTSSSAAPANRPLLKVVAVTVTGPKGSHDTFALLDDGSTATLIDSSVATAVGAEGRTSLMRVEGIGGMSKEGMVSFVDIEIKGRHSHESFPLTDVRSIPGLRLSRQAVAIEDVAPFEYLADLTDVLTYGDTTPMLLIGIDNWHLTASQHTRRGTTSQPVASLTALGWVLYGSLKGKSKESYNCVVVNHVDLTFVDTTTIKLDAALQEYFKVDSIGITKRDYHCKNDQEAINILESTTSRLPSGRFETGLLWRPDVTTMVIPNSLELARSRLASLERKFKRDGEYAEAYRGNIQSMLDKGYAEECQSTPLSKVWYLPHFGVVHPQKRKLRVVHDAAAKCSGVSLNSMLLPGPDLLQPLLAILMRFREGRFAMNGDIREMFPQTKIRPEDRDAQRFLWRDNPSVSVKEYRMSSMMFGAVSSPFTALYLKNKNANEHKEAFPAAAAAIVNDHYMDDYLGSVNTEEEARKLAAEITHVHAQAGLEMRAWVSNSKTALSALPPYLCSPGVSSVEIRVLGVSWNVNQDILRFSRKILQEAPKRLTKRSVLSHLMRLYDPLGFLTPLTIRGRILFQKTWRLCSDWDQELPRTFATSWKAWFTECEDLLCGSIPRHYLAHKLAKIQAQLHVFADASELAYACVAYWRFECLDGSVKVSLIGGKARLAPLKPLSIPRLELQAALIAARYATYILDAHKLIKVSKCFFWSDSLTVLKWLRSDARTFKPFVAHRIGEIAEVTKVSDWRHVPTALNVADDATRIDKKILISSRWFSGPPFLNLPQSEWPIEPTVETPPVLEELKRPISEVVELTNARDLPFQIVPDASRFSKWLRLLRVTARVLVCARIFKSSLLVPTSTSTRVGPCSRELSAEDMKTAERHLLLHSQLTSLREDYEQIERGGQPTNNSRLKSLTLFIDDSARLLRLSGRIGAVEGVPTVSPHPIVLHGKDRIVRLLITHHHEQAAHSSNELVVNELRQTFHIIGLRPAVKSVASSCLRCRIRKAEPNIPPIGDLPPERLAHHSRPFTHVGLDYFGPVSVSVGRHSEKRYVALFTCLTVRAVHLEVVGSLSTDAAIMALRRFIARRGTPTTLYSDNGTAFVGASRLLATLYEKPIKEFATNHRIRWKFIPPGSPFMGGCWERLVRSIKTALSTTLLQKNPAEEVLHTFLLEAEALVNSRPLTHVSVSPEEDGAITPCHFLLGSSSPYSVVADVDDTDMIRRIKWRRGLRLADHFWARWTREYLPTLIPRGPSTSNKRVEVGDQVLVVDGNLPRGVWPRGRVTRTYPGKDGVVRVVDVATRAGTLRRPVRKVVVLPS